jgi:hypothetical protein
MYNAGIVVVNLGVNPTIASYNASVVNFYNGTGSLVRFEKKLFYFEKRSRLLQRWRCSCKLKNRRIGSRSRRIGSSPDAAAVYNSRPKID